MPTIPLVSNLELTPAHTTNFRKLIGDRSSLRILRWAVLNLRMVFGLFLDVETDLIGRLGPMYLGTIANVWLYGIIVIQVTIYYASFPRDAKWIKIMVAWLLVVETLNSAFDIGLVWHYTIALFGDLDGLRHSHWFLNIGSLSTSNLGDHCTKQSWTLASTISVQFCAGLGGTIGGFIVGDFDRFHELKAPVLIWMVTSVVTDTVITSILIWYLHTHRTGNSKTDDIISRLVRSTMQTGLLVTMWMAGDLILFMVMPYNNIHLFFQLAMCKIYTASLLSTLNARKSIRESAAAEENSATILEWQGGSTGDSRNRANLHSISRRSEGYKPDTSLERPKAVAQIETTDSSRRGSSYEMRDYKGKKGENTIDVEAYADAPAFPRAAVQLPERVSNYGASDGAFVHWKNPNDGR